MRTANDLRVPIARVLQPGEVLQYILLEDNRTVVEFVEDAGHFGHVVAIALGSSGRGGRCDRALVECRVRHGAECWEGRGKGVLLRLVPLGAIFAVQLLQSSHVSLC